MRTLKRSIKYIIVISVALAACLFMVAANNPMHQYPVNASGLTYGSSAHAETPDGEPDLILAMGIGGKTGYIYKADLAAVDGSNVKSPAEAGEWMRQNKDKTFSIPVYELDGKTVIDEFVITPISDGMVVYTYE